MSLFDRIAAVHERWNVLRHPFYVRWSNGELTREELGFYAGEYRNAVVALADATSRAAAAGEPEVRAELEQHAAEEHAHVGLWDDFARAFDADLDRPPRPETAECAEAWTAGDDMLDSLAILYAIESAQPAISQTKLDGLLAHYEMRRGESGTGYFELHAKRDAEHAAHSRSLLEERLAEVDEDRLVALAEDALAGNWRLLDGVERRFGRA